MDSMAALGRGGPARGCLRMVVNIRPTVGSLGSSFAAKNEQFADRFLQAVVPTKLVATKIATLWVRTNESTKLLL